MATFEKLAQALAVVSFVSVCWVTHRSLQERTQCLNSSFVSFVQVGHERVENCANESRLSLQPLLHPLSPETTAMLRQLEVLEPLDDVFPENRARLAVEINLDSPHIFELGKGYVRLGRAWLDDGVQTRRALTMGVLQQIRPKSFTNPFELEVVTDFLLMTAMGEQEWNGHAWTELTFATSSPSFAGYCRSPFRSLAHYDACAETQPDSEDLQANVWGFRPLLASAMTRVFEKLSLREKFKWMAELRAGHVPNVLPVLHDDSIEGRAHWIEDALDSEVHALGVARTADNDLAIRRALKELEVGGPTHWELTVDLTHTPAWKDVLEQFRVWTSFRKKERVLVFTPEGAIAFPSGLPVSWPADDVQSQTHVVIACQWPKGLDAVNVSARHIFARQLCGKVDDVFWN